VIYTTAVDLMLLVAVSVLVAVIHGDPYKSFASLVSWTVPTLIVLGAFLVLAGVRRLVLATVSPMTRNRVTEEAGQD
jgi:hypothetical protein